VLDELWQYNNAIRTNSIIIIRGRVVRYSYEDGKTAFIFNEAPRAVINNVLQKMIGDPVPLMESFEKEKYDNIATKYEDNYFKINYMQKFKDIFFDGQHIPPTSKQMSVDLKHKISRLQPN
jgi:hypothetical protein